MDYQEALRIDGMTDNGALSYSTSGSPILDFFSNICRQNNDDEDFNQKFFDLLDQCVKIDPLLTLKCGFMKRDIRGQDGAGERRIFYQFYKWLNKNYPKTAEYNIKFIPEFGYWKDLNNLWANGLKNHIAELYATQLKKDLLVLNSKNHDDNGGDEPSKTISLAAKWCPSVNSSIQKKYNITQQIALKLDIKQDKWAETFRKQYLSPLRKQIDIVESHMCNGEWDKINYNYVPSQAHCLYAKSFKKNDTERYTKYLNDVINNVNDAKINTSVLMPYQLIEKYLPNKQLIPDLHLNPIQEVEAQWKSLIEEGRNYVNNTSDIDGLKMLPIPDFSGSMNGTPMMVALGLSLYIAKICPEPFRDLMVSFSDEPCIIDLKGKESLCDLIEHCSHNEHIGYNTNIQATMDLILKKCIAGSVPPEKMVKKLVMISDMQFDDAASGTTNFLEIKKKFTLYGYDMPQIVFWNVNTKFNESPVLYNEKNVIMVAGWSKNIFNMISKGIIPNPYDMMIEVLNSKRYECLKWMDNNL